MLAAIPLFFGARRIPELGGSLGIPGQDRRIPTIRTRHAIRKMAASFLSKHKPFLPRYV
jgi:hypothetical protein